MKLLKADEATRIDEIVGRDCWKTGGRPLWIISGFRAKWLK